MYFVYFIRSIKNNKIYVGFTTKNPKIRVTEHNQGSNQWSKNNGPFILVYYENFFCEEDARRREKFYKTGVGKKIKKGIVESLDP